MPNPKSILKEGITKDNNTISDNNTYSSNSRVDLRLTKHICSP